MATLPALPKELTKAGWKNLDAKKSSIPAELAKVELAYAKVELDTSTITTYDALKDYNAALLTLVKAKVNPFYVALRALDKAAQDEFPAYKLGSGKIDKKEAAKMHQHAAKMESSINIFIQQTSASLQTLREAVDASYELHQAALATRLAAVAEYKNIMTAAKNCMVRMEAEIKAPADIPKFTRKIQELEQNLQTINQRVDAQLGARSTIPTAISAHRTYFPDLRKQFEDAMPPLTNATLKVNALISALKTAAQAANTKLKQSTALTQEEYQSLCADVAAAEKVIDTQLAQLTKLLNDKLNDKTVQQFISLQLKAEIVTSIKEAKSIVIKLVSSIKYLDTAKLTLAKSRVYQKLAIESDLYQKPFIEACAKIVSAKKQVTGAKDRLTAVAGMLQ